jgi:hypothetical protein
VVPAQHVCDCGEILASRFKDTRIFRLTDLEAVRYRRGSYLGNTPQPSGATEGRRGHRAILSSQTSEELRASRPGRRQHAFVFGSRKRFAQAGVSRPTCFDVIEDLLPRSRPTARLLESSSSPAALKGRPLTPLHSGHVALCCERNVERVFGSGKGRHVAAWQSGQGGRSLGRVEENALSFSEA